MTPICFNPSVFGRNVGVRMCLYVLGSQRKTYGSFLCLPMLSFIPYVVCVCVCDIAFKLMPAHTHIYIHEREPFQTGTCKLIKCSSSSLQHNFLKDRGEARLARLGVFASISSVSVELHPSRRCPRAPAFLRTKLLPFRTPALASPCTRGRA